MLKLDKKTVLDFQQKGVKKIKIFFYSAGCSGTKLDIALDEFEVDDSLGLAVFSEENKEYPFDVYVEKKDVSKFENASITRLVKADHTGIAISRYVYASEKVEDKCGCGTSFAFEKKKPKFDFTKLKYLKTEFKQ